MTSFFIKYSPNLWSISLILISTSCLFYACKTDAVKPVQEKAVELEGYWGFDKVLRNDKETNTLDNGYFKFDNQNKEIYSNIFTGSQPYKYSTDGGNLTISGPENMKFLIESFSNDSLTLKGRIGPFKMSLWMTKQDTISIDSSLYN